MQSFQQVLRTWGGGSLKFDGEGRAQWRGDIGIDGGSFRKINRRMAPHAPSPPPRHCGKPWY